MFLITEGIACSSILHTNSGCNITGVYTFNILPVVCMHLQNTADTLVRILNRVVYRSASRECAGIHTEIAQLAHKGVSSNLKRKSSCLLYTSRLLRLSD